MPGEPAEDRHELGPRGPLTPWLDSCCAQVAGVGGIRGAGVVIDAWHIVTCAHVAGEAAGASGTDHTMPSGVVMVDFPWAGEPGSVSAPVEAQVVAWRPYVRGEEHGDVAVLRMASPVSRRIAPPLLRPPVMRGDAFRACGWPEGSAGEKAGGEIGEPCGPRKEWVAVTQPVPGNRIREGYSGSPIWHDALGAVVGIVVTLGEEDSATAYMIPVGVLAATWPPLKGLAGWRVRFSDLDRRRHWDPRARGVKEFEHPGDYFTGRRRALEHLVTWLGAADRRACVITGLPGSGKSSVLARLIMAADDVERPRLTSPAPEVDRAIDLAIVATGLAPNEFVEQIARWCDVHVDLTTDAGAAAAVATLVEGLRDRVTTPVIAIDQLDGARQPDVVIRKLLRPLVDGNAARLLIGLQATEDGGALLRLMDAWAERVDLDGTYEDVEGLEDYIHRWLVESEHADYTADPDGIARTVARAAAARASPLFLVGLLVGLWLRTQPVRADRAEDEFPAEVPDAMRLYLEGLADQLYNEGVAVHQASGAVAELRDVIKRRLDALMGALAYAEEPGLPAAGGVWPAVSRAVAEVGRDGFDEADVTWLRDSAANFLVQDADVAGIRHVRLFHDALVQAMRVAPEARAEIQARIVAELADLYPDGCASPTDRYVERQLPAHVAKATPSTWGALASRAELLDRLDPAAVRSHALLFELQRGELPREIVGMIQSHDLLILSGPRDRRALRQLGVARVSDERQFLSGLPLEPAPAWTIQSAVVTPHPAHLPLDVGAAVSALVAFTGPRGRPIIAAGCDDGTVRLWDATTGERSGASLLGAGAVCALAACETQAGIRLACAADDRTIRIWDPYRDGAPESIVTARGHIRAIAAFAAQGVLRIAVAVDEVDEIAILHGNGDPIATVTGRGPFRSLLTVGSGATVALYGGSEDGSVSVWHIGTELDATTPIGPAAVLTGPTDWVRALCAIDIGGVLRVAGAGDDRKLRIWSPSATVPLREAETGHAATILTMATYRAGDDHIVATAGVDGTIGRTGAESGLENGQPLTGHHGQICALVAYEVAADTPRLASAGKDRKLRLWDPLGARGTRSPRAHRVTALAISRGGLIVTGGDDGMVRVWDPANGDRLQAFDAEVGAVRAMAPGYGDSEYAFGGDGELVRFRDIRSGEETEAALDGHSGSVRALTGWTHEKKAMLASAGDDGIVRLWERGSEPCHPLAIARYDNPVRGLAVFSGRWGPRLAIAGHARTVEIRGTTPGDTHRIGLHGHQDWVMAVCAYSGRNGVSRLATAGDDETVQSWSTLSGEQLAVLGRHDGPVRTIAGRGTRLVTGGDDGTVRLWDSTTSRQLHVMRLGATVNVVAFIANGIVAGTDEGHLVIDLASDLGAA